MAVTHLKDKSVGDVVRLNVNGVATEFRVIQKGRPDTSIYPTNDVDEGVWLLMSSVVTTMIWSEYETGIYSASKVREYLEGDFLGMLDSKVANAIITINLPYYRPAAGNVLRFPCKAFVLSAVELGFPVEDLVEDEYSSSDGCALDYFRNNANTRRMISKDSTDDYWTRSIYLDDSKFLVTIGGRTGARGIWRLNGTSGVRPAFILPQDSIVDDDGNIIINNPPTAPYSITVPEEIRSRHSVTISWGASTDSDGNLSGYRLYEISPDNDARAIIYDGTSRSYTYTVPDIAKVQYSVCAYDTYGSVSEETVSAVRTVTSNSLPTITTSSGSSLGTRTSGFKIAYTVDDADAEDTITVKEYLDGKQKRSFTATHGGSYSFDVTGEYFQKILNGEHTLEIVADDGNYTLKDAQSGIQTTTTKKFTFTKSVHNAVITLAEPMTADDQITLCIISVTGSIPSDATFEVEVTNNGNDSTPVWEDCTTAAKNGYNHSFKNQTAANGFAFNFRVTAGHDSTSSTEGYIQSIQGGFQ